jgi:hypothetical protein
MINSSIFWLLSSTIERLHEIEWYYILTNIIKENKLQNYLELN